MASPFVFFRKNQKILLGGLVIVSLLTFTIGGFLLDYLSTQQVDPSDAALMQTVVHYDGVSRTGNELIELANRRRPILQFVAAIGRRFQENDIQARSVAALSPVLASDDEQSLVAWDVLRRRAEANRLAVSDEAIKDYLARLTGGALTNRELLDLWRSTAGPRRGTEDNLFARLRDELLVRQQFMIEFPPTAILPTVTPADRLRAVEATRQQVRIATRPFAVASFTKSVGEPTNAQLRTFFNDHAGEVANRLQGEPGFYQPYRAAFGYVTINFQEELDRLKKEITPEEVRKAYEEGVAAGKYRQTSFPGTSSFDGNLSLPDLERMLDETAPSSEDGPSSPSEPPTQEPTAPEGTDGTVDPPSTPQSSPAETSEPAPASPEAPAPGTEPEPASPGPQEQSGRVRSEDGLTFVSLQPDAPADEPSEVPAPSTATETPTTETPAPETPAADQPPANAPPADGEEPKVRPLSEVEDQIRGELAQPRAEASFRSKYDTIRTRFLELAQQYGADPNRQTAAETSRLRSEIKTAATRLGLVYQETPLTTVEDAIDRDRTKHFEFFNLGRPLAMFGIEPLIVRLYGSQGDGSGTPAFQPVFTVFPFDPQPGQPMTAFYSAVVTWRIADQAAHRPEFEDVRDQVRQAWLAQQARALAQEAADAFVATAKAATPTNASDDVPASRFKAASAQDTVIPPPFTPWLAEPGNPMMGQVASARPRQLPELTRLGPEFADTLMTLGVGQMAIVPNGEKSVYYAVEMLDKNPPSREMFQAAVAPLDQTVQTFFQTQIQLQQSRLLDELILTPARVRWERPPVSFGDN